MEDGQRCEISVRPARKLLSFRTALGGFVAGHGGLAFQDPFETYSDHRADDRAGDVDPCGLHIAAHHIGRQRTDRVHRGAANRRGPKSGERDIAPDGERAVRTDITRARRGAKDRANEAGG